MNQKISCKILFYDKEVLNEDCDMVVLPGELGDLGILFGHVPMIVAIKQGKIRIYIDGVTNNYEVGGGIAKITRDSCIIIADR